MARKARSTKRFAVLAACATACAATGIALTVATAGPSSAATCTGYVALTFDDGPSASNTATLLSTLKAAGARATLFNIGQNAQANPDLVRAEAAAGMWIGNHSWTHPYMTQQTEAQMISEISQAQQVIKDLTGTTPTLFRPPYFDTNATLKAVEAQYGLTEILADVDSKDWNSVSTADIITAATTLQSGGIMLMHDWPPNTIAAIPQIVSDLTARGLCPGMISPATGRAVAPDSVPASNPASAAPASTPASTSPAAPSQSSTSPTNPGTSSCTAAYSLVSSWSGGFQGTFTVSNSGTSAVSSWKVGLTLTSGQTIQSLWNGTASGTSGAITVTNAAYNGSIAAGANTSFGFVASGSGAASPTGITCTVS